MSEGHGVAQRVGDKPNGSPWLLYQSGASAWTSRFGACSPSLAAQPIAAAVR